MLSPSVVTFIASVSIPAGARVKFVAGSVTSVTLADHGDVEIGTAILHSGKSSYAAGDGVGVALINHPGTIICLASGAISGGQTVNRADGGAVSQGGAGDNFGTALADAGDGDWLEALRNPGMLVTVADGAVTTQKLAGGAVTGAKMSATAFKLYAVAGADSSGGAQDLATAGVLATDRIVEVIDLTTPAVLANANFTPGANKVTQAQAAGNLSAKKLLIRLLPASA